jgi:hypothetical protein
LQRKRTKWAIQFSRTAKFDVGVFEIGQISLRTGLQAACFQELVESSRISNSSQGLFQSL